MTASGLNYAEKIKKANHSNSCVNICRFDDHSPGGSESSVYTVEYFGGTFGPGTFENLRDLSAEFVNHEVSVVLDLEAIEKFPEIEKFDSYLPLSISLTVGGQMVAIAGRP